MRSHRPREGGRERERERESECVRERKRARERERERERESQPLKMAGGEPIVQIVDANPTP